MSKGGPAPKKSLIAKLRNLGIIAHIDAGKTTLTERILFYTHRIHRMGEVHDGAATMDYMPEEQERGITITAACTTCQWRDARLNLIDTPGHVDFTIEVERSLRVLDGAVGVFCAVGGVEPQSETVWRQSERHHVPKLAFINKLDRPGADFAAVLEEMRQRLGARPLVLTTPLGQGPEFSAVVDLLDMRRLEFDAGSRGAEVREQALSAEDAELARPWREALLESLAEEDDGLMEAYLGGEELPAERLRPVIRRLTLERKIVPTYAGAALRNIGVQPLLDGIVDFLPSPLEAAAPEGLDPSSNAHKVLEVSAAAPLAALAFKVSMDGGRKLVWLRLYAGSLEAGQGLWNATRGLEERAARLFHLHAGHREAIDSAFAGDIVAVAGLKEARTGETLASAAAPVVLERLEASLPVISLALEPRTAADTDKLEFALGHLLQEDPTLAVERDEATGQLILSGMGELHLEVIRERLTREYGVSPRAGRPQVVRQETVSRAGSGSAEFHRELGETMHHGFVAVTVEPLARGRGREVLFEVDREGWPEALWQAAAEGLEDGLQSGVLEGHPLADLRLRVTELRRQVDSTPAGFRMAAAQALREALQAAGPQLLEPLMRVEISVPAEFVGDVVGLLGAKGAKIEDMADRGGQKLVRALAPLRRLFGFSTELRSATQGRAGLNMHFERFDTLD